MHRDETEAHICEMGLTFLILTTEGEKADALERLLLQFGAKACYKALDVEQAYTLYEETLADCIIFSHKEIPSMEALFRQFPTHGLWFVPWSNRRDNSAVIEAINTQRTCYYLKDPVQPQEVQSMVRNLCSYLQTEEDIEKDDFLLVTGGDDTAAQR